eukprot:gene10691-2789_t
MTTKRVNQGLSRSNLESLTSLHQSTTSCSLSSSSFFSYPAAFMANNYTLGYPPTTTPPSAQRGTGPVHNEAFGSNGSSGSAKGQELSNALPQTTSLNNIPKKSSQIHKTKNSSTSLEQRKGDSVTSWHPQSYSLSSHQHSLSSRLPSSVPPYLPSNTSLSALMLHGSPYTWQQASQQLVSQLSQAPWPVDPISARTMGLPNYLNLSHQLMLNAAASGLIPFNNTTQNLVSRSRSFVDDRYVCEVCNKAFTSSSNLNRHRRIHTGDKPYKCQYCGAAFNNSSNRRKHERLYCKERRSEGVQTNNTSSIGNSSSETVNSADKHSPKHRLSPSTKSTSSTDTLQPKGASSRISSSSSVSTDTTLSDGVAPSVKTHQHQLPSDTTTSNESLLADNKPIVDLDSRNGPRKDTDAMNNGANPIQIQKNQQELKPAPSKHIPYPEIQPSTSAGFKLSSTSYSVDGSINADKAAAYHFEETTTNGTRDMCPVSPVLTPSGTTHHEHSQSNVICGVKVVSKPRSITEVSSHTTPVHST